MTDHELDRCRWNFLKINYKKKFESMLSAWDENMDCNSTIKMNFKKLTTDSSQYLILQNRIRDISNSRLTWTVLHIVEYYNAIPQKII